MGHVCFVWDNSSTSVSRYGIFRIAVFGRMESVLCAQLYISPEAVVSLTIYIHTGGDPCRGLLMLASIFRLSQAISCPPEFR
jgi:hypothetical protein